MIRKYPGTNDTDLESMTPKERDDWYCNLMHDEAMKDFCPSDLEFETGDESNYLKKKIGEPRRSGVSVSLRFSILKRDRFRCRLCGHDSRTSRLEIDHKISVSNGGTNEPDNLWVLCFSCNRGKGSQNHEEGSEDFY